MSARLTAKGMFGYHADDIRVAAIKAAVCLAFNVSRIEMVSARRSRKVARPRQVAMYLSRELTPHSLPSIGRMFGNRDHTTVMHAIAQVERLTGEDPALRHKIETLREELISTNIGTSVENSHVHAFASLSAGA